MSNRHLTLNIPTTKLVIFLHNPHLTATAPIFFFFISCKSILSVSQAKTFTPHSLTTQYNPLGKKICFNISRIQSLLTLSSAIIFSSYLDIITISWLYSVLL